MSLDIYLSEMREVDIFSHGITHNLNKMAELAGIYKCLWHPSENGITKAYQLVQPLIDGLTLMKEYPEQFKKLDAKNGWGTYEQFIPWIEELLKACRDNPLAKVSVSI